MATHCSLSFTKQVTTGEKKTKWVMLLTFVTMIAEILAGMVYGSMGLLADGWHMSSHLLAFGLTLFAYSISRKLANDPRFSLGTWKIEILAAFTSALLLMSIAFFMAYHSVIRLINPIDILYHESLFVASIGLIVNLVSAYLLHQSETHQHDHHDHHSHNTHSHTKDLNLYAAYYHVLADAATSVFAIVALVAAMIWGLIWLDALMGIIGSFLVGYWAFGLMRKSAMILVDAEMDSPVVQEIKDAILAGDPTAKIVDLHVWKYSQDHYACMLTIHSPNPMSSEDYRKMLQIHEELAHITIETHVSP